MDEAKKCRLCNETKPLEEFHRATGMRDGHRNECKACFRQLQHQRYLANRQRYISKVQEWRRRNPEKYRAWLRRNREERKEERRAIERAGHLRRQYGMTVDDYEFLVVAQGGRCAVCGRPDGRELHVDHDHRTGIVRGLLCGSCNRAMGLFHEDARRFHAAALYLRRRQLMLGCGDKRSPRARRRSRPTFPS